MEQGVFFFFFKGEGGENHPILFILIFFVRNYLFAQILRGEGKSVLLARHALLKCYVLEGFEENRNRKVIFSFISCLKASNPWEKMF